jgi:DNA-binding MarR family transcriptional regulator
MEKIRRIFSGRELQAVEAVITLRTTAQQAENALTEWFSGTAGSPARWQILMLLSAAQGRSVPHTEIVTALGVTRATVSGLMAALERELLAILTAKGESVIGTGIEINRNRLRAAFASLSSAELTTLTALLHRVREGFAASANAAKD